MTEAATEAPTLTEVLVRHAIYQYAGITRIAVDDFTLQDLDGDNTVRVTLDSVTMIEEPGSPAWVTRMARVRRSLVGITTNLKNDNENLTRWQEGIGEALLEKAVEKEWCEEYDDFAEEWDLPKRDKEWEVTITVKVSARNEDAALELVKGNVSLQPWNVDGVVDSPEFEASEA